MAMTCRCKLHEPRHGHQRGGAPHLSLDTIMRHQSNALGLANLIDVNASVTFKEDAVKRLPGDCNPNLKGIEGFCIQQQLRLAGSKFHEAQLNLSWLHIKTDM
eukprot:1158991-Pelagomonas_calceolata.AAC.9